MSSAANPDLKAAYQRDGFVIVEDLFAPGEMAGLKLAVQGWVSQSGKPDPSGVRVWMVETLPAELRGWMADARVVRVLHQLIGPRPEFLSVKAVFKNAATTFASPWHQDAFYWHGSTKLSIWIALDDATPANGCLKIIPGTHRALMEMGEVKTGQGFELQIAEAQLAGRAVVSVPLRRGSALFFHDRLVHSSHPNSAGADRWSLISTYRDAGEKDESRTWKSSMPV